MAFGINFLPGADEQEPEGGGGSVGRPSPNLQQAVRLLNLRLPTVNQGGIAPNALLQSPGGSPDMNSALSMQSLQRLFMALAGMGQGSPQGAGGYGAPAAPQAVGGIGAPNVAFDPAQRLPPSPIGPGVSPPGPGNLPPSPIGPGVSPPGPGNLPMTAARSHGGKNDPMAEFLRTNGKVGRGVSPPGPPLMPKPLPRVRPITSHGPGSGAPPTAIRPKPLPRPKISGPEFISAATRSSRGYR